MRKIAYILFITLFATNLYGQEYFNNRYDFYGYADVARPIIPMIDGYVFGGSAYDSVTLNLEVAIAKIDLQGNLIWKKSYGKALHNYFHGESHSMIKNIEGNFVMAGAVDDTSGNDDVMIYVFEDNGDTIWTKRYSDAGFEAGAQIRQTLDSGFVVIGFETIGNTQVLLMKVDKDGIVEWKKNYNYGGEAYGYNIEVCDDKGYIIGGVNNSSTRKTLIIKTDSIGNVEWTKQYGGSFDNCRAVIKQSADGGFVVGTCEGVYELNSYEQQRAKVMKLNTNGDEEWSNLYGHPRANAEPFAIHELGDGAIVLLGQQADTSLLQQSNGWPEGYILKVSPTGDSIWHRVIEHLTGPQSLNYPRDMQVTTDGGFVVSGWCTPAPPDVGTQDMWVIKLDSMGCAVAGCDTVTGIEMPKQVRHDPLEVKVYPNPASNEVTVEVSGETLKQVQGDNEKVLLQLFDITGRQAAQWQLQKGNSEHDVSHLPAGVYFYKAGNQTGKLVIQK